MDRRDQPWLVPSPQRLELHGGTVAVPALVVAAWSAGQVAVAVPESIERGTGGFVRARLTGGACGTRAQDAQGYRLHIGSAGVAIEACAKAGLRHGLATLTQLLRQYASHLPLCDIEDRPDFAVRGVMLDISRCRVPTMRKLYELVDLFASLKVNHLQLYTEHTFAYFGHEAAWAGCSPMTHAEVMRLDDYCRDRGIDLAANQNCFGHLAHWLNLPAYRHLAETHGDWLFDVWPRSGPFSLCPTDPASLKFVEGLLDQLLPCFQGEFVSIGCDETYDIAYGRSKQVVVERGRESVYMDFVNQVVEACHKRGKRAMFWGDIALSKPEVLRTSREDLIALAWGYEGDSPFERWCEQIAACGRETWVCPGTSSWRSITGRTQERRGNLSRAAGAGKQAGAGGMLVCDWGDLGHRQQWPIALQGLAEGAARSWNAGSPMNTAGASLHVFGDASGRVSDWLDLLGDLDLPLREVCGPLSRADRVRLPNATALFADMHTSMSQHVDVGDRRLWQAMPERVQELRRALPGPLNALLADELDHACEVALFAAWRGAFKRGGPPTASVARPEARAWINQVIADHERLWRISSREGGLIQSTGYYRGIAEATR